MLERLRKRSAAPVCVLVSVLVAAGCGGSSTTSPAPTTTVTPTTLYFSGTLAKGATSFAPVTVTQAGAFTVTLTSLTVGAGVTNPASPAVMALGVGVASADGLSCTVSDTVNVAPSLTTQLTSQAVAGTSCVQISDIGNLTAPVNFLIRVVHT